MGNGSEGMILQPRRRYISNVYTSPESGYVAKSNLEHFINEKPITKKLITKKLINEKADKRKS